MGKNKKQNKAKPEGAGLPVAIGGLKITVRRKNLPAENPADNREVKQNAKTSVVAQAVPSPVVESRGLPKANSRTGLELWEDLDEKPTTMDESDALYADILVELECPICIQYMTPPIRQCETGHSICQPCMKKLFQCPLCQKNFISAKNISLQALACKVPYPCVNQSLGCTAKLKLDQRENHEKNCLFRGFKCAMEDCTWVEKLEDIANHWICKGNLFPVRSSMIRCRASIKMDSYCVTLVEEYNQLFWSKRKLKNGRIYWAVQLIGPVDKASNYFYEINIYESETSERRIILRDYCKSIEIDNNNLFSEDTCITTVRTDCVRHFLKANQFLGYYIQINEKLR